MAGINRGTYAGRNSGKHDGTEENNGGKGSEGYDTELFQPPADNKYICLICLLVCCNPVQTFCGHRFCNNCIRTWIRVKPKCPGDNKHLTEEGIYPDQIANREILGLNVRCRNHAAGCTYTGELSTMLQTHVEKCDHEPVTCTNGCGARPARNLLEKHLQSECTTTCKYCFQKVPLTNREKHMAECEYNDFKCTLCGAGPILVKDREEHLLECPKGEVACQLSALGCETKLMRDEMDSHCEANVVQHVQLLSSYVQRVFPRGLPSDASKPQVRASCSSLDDQLLTHHTRSLSTMDCQQPLSEPYQRTMAHDSGVSLAEKSRIQGVKLAKQDQHILELQAKVSYLEKKLKESCVTLRQQHDMITDLESRCSKGIYHWKITEYLRRSREAKMGTTTVLHSPGFYSSFNGYKMCLRVNLNGVETGHNTHLSLFVHLMRGEFDDLLAWPFTGKITLTIIDQSEDGRHIVETLEGNESIAAFHRPTSSRNHKGFGYMEFVPLNRIEGTSFVKGDMLIIRCQVQEPS